LWNTVYIERTIEPLKQKGVPVNELLVSHPSPLLYKIWHCCKVSDEAAFCLIQRPYISKTLLTRRISPRGSP
ncbi:hypothetical protein, partial [Klebsiella pneumoniae]|uniref:hypothetical protein n=1 Tax=Klebsiella pneumoniae TaxID=573 RepID=UPI00301C4A2C